MGAGSSPGAGSSDRSLSGDIREALIDAALKLFARQGYDVTTAEQIAAEAGIPEADFASYFTTPEAALMSIVDDMMRDVAAALKDIEPDGHPERALLTAGSAMVTAVVEGRGAIPIERLLALARIVSSTRNLHRTVSVARRRAITQPLADWMGVDADDRRLQRAITMWSAVTASAYVTGADIPDDYQPQRDSGLRQRMIANIAQSFGEVMGEDPAQPG